jgi:hypothetical protein
VHTMQVEIDLEAGRRTILRLYFIRRLRCIIQRNERIKAQLQAYLQTFMFFFLYLIRAADTLCVKCCPLCCTPSRHASVV